MRSLLLLIPLALLLHPTGVAQEDPYHVQVTHHAFEAPSSGNGSAYDCAGPGPYGVGDTVFYNVGELTEGERTPAWMGIPYFGPECLAVDVRTPDLLARLPPIPCDQPARDFVEDGLGDRVRLQDSILSFPPIPSPSTDASARGTYNLSSGRYYLGLGAPSIWASPPVAAAGEDLELSGDTGVSIKFDCRECEPPW